MKALRICGLALLLIAAAAVAGVGIPETAGGAERPVSQGITVIGTGTADAVPDEAAFSIGVSTKATTAREALAANTEQMQRVIAALKAAGVQEVDIKTQDVSVGANYDDSRGASGYAARNSVSVRVRDLDRAGAVLDAASRAGANEVYGPSLTRSNREDLEAKALASAVKNARKRAEALANAAGVRLGRVTGIVEGFNGGPQPMIEARAAADSSVAAPIEAGTEEIQASVTVTFAIE